MPRTSSTSGSASGKRPAAASHASSPHAASRGAKSNTGSSSSSSITTTDHEEIQRWAEERGGKPACVQGTGGKSDVGLLRIEFPGKPGAKDDKLQEIVWDEFFEKFDESGLALVYQEQTAEGDMSNFNKFVSRDAEESAGKGSTAKKQGAKKKAVGKTR